MSRRPRCSCRLVFLAIVFALGVSAQDREFNPRTVIDRPFRPIVDAPFLEASEVVEEVLPEELVLGIVIDGKAKAYPINMLTGPRREIINDELGGRKIAATW